MNNKQKFEQLFKTVNKDNEYVSRRQELERVIQARRLQGWTDEEIYIRYFKL